MDAHKSQTDTNSPSPTKDDEERCSRCGAILSGKNAGDEVCYCPNCGDFVAPLENGKGVYTCGFGKFEKKTEFVYDRETYLSIQTRLFNNPPSEYPIAILIGNDASAEEQPSPLAIFRLLPGEFYPWAIGRLFCAAAEIDPPDND